MFQIQDWYNFASPKDEIKFLHIGIVTSMNISNLLPPPPPNPCKSDMSEPLKILTIISDTSTNNSI